MIDPTWLEVSLTVEPELAEAVAEVLSRFAPKGVVIESTSVISDEVNLEGKIAGPLRVAAYLLMDQQIEQTRIRLEESLWYLGRIQSLPDPEYRVIHAADWTQAWKSHYHPIPIGQRLIIVPAWLNVPDKERISILMDPGMAFGTGTHPTTQLCLQFEEELIPQQDSSGRKIDVIDIGCGSGILFIAALKLGALRALGIDTDPVAVESARANAALNNLTEAYEVGLGSLSEISQCTFSIQRADLVLANILSPVLIKLLDHGLANLLTTRGKLVLSGIIEDQVDEIDLAVRRNGLEILDRKQFEDWVALLAG